MGGLWKKGRAAYTRLDHHPQLWQPHEVLVQTRVLGREERGKNTLPNFPILFKHKTATGYYDLSIVISDKAQNNRSDKHRLARSNVCAQDGRFAESDIEDPPSLTELGVQKLRTREYCHI